MVEAGGVRMDYHETNSFNPAVCSFNNVSSWYTIKVKSGCLHVCINRRSTCVWCVFCLQMSPFIDVLKPGHGGKYWNLIWRIHLWARAASFCRWQESQLWWQTSSTSWRACHHKARRWEPYDRGLFPWTSKSFNVFCKSCFPQKVVYVSMFLINSVVFLHSDQIRANTRPQKLVKLLKTILTQRNKTLTLIGLKTKHVQKSSMPHSWSNANEESSSCYGWRAAAKEQVTRITAILFLNECHKPIPTTASNLWTLNKS